MSDILVPHTLKLAVVSKVDDKLKHLGRSQASDGPGCRQVHQHLRLKKLRKQMSDMLQLVVKTGKSQHAT